MVINHIDINLKDTIESGQCFRYTKENDGSYTIVLSDRVVNMKQVSDKLYVKSSKDDNLEEIIINYLDLNTDYEFINKKLIDMNGVSEKYINASKGYKILNQNSFEMLISFIISQNNNVKRISGIVNNFSKAFGEKIVFNDKEYYLFPKLEDIDIEKIDELKLGYRKTYIEDVIKKINNSIIDLNLINNLSGEDALVYLMKIKGVGLKVASCVLLFGYHKLDVFPIDRWVIKLVRQDFKFLKDDINSISEYISKEFNEYSAVIIQYMFHYARNKEE